VIPISKLIQDEISPPELDPNSLRYPYMGYSTVLIFTVIPVLSIDVPVLSPSIPKPIDTAIAGDINIIRQMTKIVFILLPPKKWYEGSNYFP
jgi:hypothetical protein